MELDIPSDFRFFSFSLLGVSTESVFTQEMQINALTALNLFSFKQWLNKSLYNIAIATITNHHTKGLKETN